MRDLLLDLNLLLPQILVILFFVEELFVRIFNSGADIPIPPDNRKRPFAQCFLHDADGNLAGGLCTTSSCSWSCAVNTERTKSELVFVDRFPEEPVNIGDVQIWIIIMRRHSDFETDTLDMDKDVFGSSIMVFMAADYPREIAAKFFSPIVVVSDDGSKPRDVMQDQSSLRVKCEIAMTLTDASQSR